MLLVVVEHLIGMTVMTFDTRDVLKYFVVVGMDVG